MISCVMEQVTWFIELRYMLVLLTRSDTIEYSRPTVYSSFLGLNVPQEVLD